jgi:patatin-like phospholipase/acyl hydrolase
MTEQLPFRVLALDGGGIRGLYTAVLLRDLCKLLYRESGKRGDDAGCNFHLISGTSTGGILACALAAGISADRIVELYERNGPLIFKDPMPSNSRAKVKWGFRNIRKAANSPAPLK